MVILSLPLPTNLVLEEFTVEPPARRSPNLRRGCHHKHTCNAESQPKHKFPQNDPPTSLDPRQKEKKKVLQILTAKHDPNEIPLDLILVRIVHLVALVDGGAVGGDATP